MRWRWPIKGSEGGDGGRFYRSTSLVCNVFFLSKIKEFVASLDRFHRPTSSVITNTQFLFPNGMSYNSEQGHYSYLCTGSSSSMVFIEGNEIFNTRDTTHERQTPEKAECLDDIGVATYTMRNRKKTSIVWQELATFKLADGIEKVQCNHCEIKLAKNQDGTTTQYKRYLDSCVKRQVSLKGQGNRFLPPQAPRSDSVSGIQTSKYDQAKIREVFS
ncbi:hypothetical protein GOBAR_DD29394 [Gossypium barbadense]|nr:hypothetical protein GOBAR_DD29394 [Gossypium barbadense]